MLKERLIFIEWNNTDSQDEISTYSKAFGDGKSIEMKRIKLKNYVYLYEAINSYDSKYNALLSTTPSGVKLKCPIIFLNLVTDAELAELDY